jgi:cytochrome c biogenesis protein CcmG/thiol:disulfide interchange protein DsbE
MSVPDDGSPARGGLSRFAPLLAFLVIGGLFAGYLIASQFFGYDRDTLPSTLIGSPAPTVALPPLEEGAPTIDAEALRAPGVKLVNVWASWCVPCRVEHPFLVDLATAGVTVFGINYRDTPANARGFLEEMGDPFARIGTDRTGRAGVEWGVYGVPETFVIDGEGVIVFKHVGPLQRDVLENKLWPAIRAAGG